MRILKEAYTEHIKAVVAPDYVTLEHHPSAVGQETLHMSRAEAQELVEWLSHELNRILPEVMKLPVIYAETFDYTKPRELAKAGARIDVPTPVPVYEPGARTATQTVEIKVGDPNLAYRHTGGRSSVPGDGDAGVMDLGALAEKVGRV